MSTSLNIQTVKQACPSTLRNNITQEFVDKLNLMHTNPLIRQHMQDNALGYISVLTEGRFKIDDYLNAVKFVTFRLSGSTQIEAYTKTFPDRYAKMQLEGATSKDISAYVSMYAKGKLVTLMLEKAMIPVWLVNADNYQKAINTQVEIMGDVNNSAMARTTAANSVLTHLKPPEVAKVDISINDSTQKSAIDELREATQKLARQQKLSIESGTLTAKDVAHSTVIEGEAKEINPNE